MEDEDSGVSKYFAVTRVLKGGKAGDRYELVSNRFKLEVVDADRLKALLSPSFVHYHAIDTLTTGNFGFDLLVTVPCKVPALIQINRPAFTLLSLISVAGPEWTKRAGW